MEKEYFKLRWEKSGRSFSTNEFRSVKFIDYIRDEAGTPIGIEIEYDGGHGYGFDRSHKRVKLYPHQKANLDYWYTDTSEGGSDWFDDSMNNIVELIPIEEYTDQENQSE